MQMNFSRNLALLRKGKGITQEAMAEKCGVSRQAVTKWECGNSLPDLYKVSDIAKILEVTVDELLHDKIVDKSVSMVDQDSVIKLEAKMDDILAEIRKQGRNILDEYIAVGESDYQRFKVNGDVPADAFTFEGIQAMEKGDFTVAIECLEEGLVRGDTEAGEVLLSLYKEIIDIYAFDKNEYEYFQIELEYLQKIQKCSRIMEMQLREKLHWME